MTGAARGGVLIADDEAEMRSAMHELLEEYGFRVCGEAVDGVEAVQMTEDLEPDVILLDLRMPRMGGLDASRVISQRWPSVQVVMFTAYDDPALSEEAIQAGAFAYLVKGCRGDLVRDVLLQAISRKMCLENRAIS